MGFTGETATEVEKLADHYTRLRVGQLGGLCANYFRDQKVSQAIMAGQIAPGNLFDLLPDLKGALLLARLKERNAETIFSAIARRAEESRRRAIAGDDVPRGLPAGAGAYRGAETFQPADG